MEINKEYISKKNVYSRQNKPKYIVVHETDNWSNGANAKKHAQAQHNGNLSTSVHFYSGSDGVYQAADLRDGTYSVGKEYGGNHSVKDATNKNTINIEICVNPDGDYEVARANCIELVKQLMQETGISADNVIRHFDAKGKYCPRNMMDNPVLWEDFKKQIGDESELEPDNITDVHDKESYYRVGTGWEDGFCVKQIGAYTNLENAKKVCKEGYFVFDENGNVVYPIEEDVKEEVKDEAKDETKEEVKEEQPTTPTQPTSSTQTQKDPSKEPNGKVKGEYKVRLLTNLNIRNAPNGTVTQVGGAKKGFVYTIVQTSGNWGKLKSGAGWISVSSKYVTMAK